MKSAPTSGLRRTSIAVLVAAVLCSAGLLIYDRGRPAPVPLQRTLFDGVTYSRQVRLYPRWRIVHVLKVDLHNDQLRFLVTPPDDNSDTPLKARTTTQFMREFGVQIAINAGGFSPWWSHSPLDYYPHAGDPVKPNGIAASQGKVYSEGPGAALYISRGGSFVFNYGPEKVYNAISGDRMLVLKGSPAADLDDTDLNPRTAIGLSASGRWLIMVVVDGRQPYYSEGATLAELAQIMVEEGAGFAMNLDGGGSSTMAVAVSGAQPEILNSPIDNYIPMRERPVANHLGIFVGK